MKKLLLIFMLLGIFLSCSGVEGSPKNELVVLQKWFQKHKIWNENNEDLTIQEIKSF